MNCRLPLRHFPGPLAGATAGGGARGTSALLHPPSLSLSPGPQITKLKQQLQRTKLSRTGKEKERCSPLQGDHAVRGALRVCHLLTFSPLSSSMAHSPRYAGST